MNAAWCGQVVSASYDAEVARPCRPGARARRRGAARSRCLPSRSPRRNRLSASPRRSARGPACWCGWRASTATSGAPIVWAEAAARIPMAPAPTIATRVSAPTAADVAAVPRHRRRLHERGVLEVEPARQRHQRMRAAPGTTRTSRRGRACRAPSARARRGCSSPARTARTRRTRRSPPPPPACRPPARRRTRVPRSGCFRTAGT